MRWLNLLWFCDCCVYLCENKSVVLILFVWWFCVFLSVSFEQMLFSALKCMLENVKFRLALAFRVIPTVHIKWPKVIFMSTVVNAVAYWVYRNSENRNKQIEQWDSVEIGLYCLCNRYYYQVACVCWRLSRKRIIANEKSLAMIQNNWVLNIKTLFLFLKFISLGIGAELVACGCTPCFCPGYKVGQGAFVDRVQRQ